MGGYSGGTSADDVLRLRRMAALSGSATYTDATLIAIIQRYPVVDSDGYWPEEDAWTATYDLASAAAEIWEEKAASVASYFTFDADGANFQKAQVFDHYSKQARKWRALRTTSGWEAVTIPATDSDSTVWIGNVNNPLE